MQLKQARGKTLRACSLHTALKYTKQFRNLCKRQLTNIKYLSLQRKVEEAKRDIIRNYPYMNLFVTLAFREEKEILTLIADSMDQYSTMLSGIYQKADLSCFKTGIDASAVLKMCLFVADGVLNEQFRNDSIDAESYFTEVESYLQLLEENMCW